MSKTLMVREGSTPNGRELAFKLEPTIQITAGTKAERLQDLKRGEKVTVTYQDGSDGSHMAQRIDVARAASGASATHATKPGGSR